MLIIKIITYNISNYFIYSNLKQIQVEPEQVKPHSSSTNFLTKQDKITNFKSKLVLAWAKRMRDHQNGSSASISCGSFKIRAMMGMSLENAWCTVITNMT